MRTHRAQNADTPGGTADLGDDRVEVGIRQGKLFDSRVRCPADRPPDQIASGDEVVECPELNTRAATPDAASPGVEFGAATGRSR